MGMLALPAANTRHCCKLQASTLASYRRKKNTLMASLIIDKRFCGPPNSANGGYVCGLLANAMGGSGEVTLRAPPPLDQRLDLVATADGTVELREAQTVLAMGRPMVPDGGEIPSASLAEAIAAADRTAFADANTHPLPGCFVCGPERALGDGLRIFVGPVAAHNLRQANVVAAPWTASPDLAGEDGRIGCEFVWAALDCPSGFACHGPQLGISGKEPILLGRMAAHIKQWPRASEKYVIVAWPTGRDGRKLFANSALLARDGKLLVIAQATWLIVGRQVQLGRR
jgi:hypothetical protein